MSKKKILHIWRSTNAQINASIVIIFKLSLLISQVYNIILLIVVPNPGVHHHSMHPDVFQSFHLLMQKEISCKWKTKELRFLGSIFVTEMQSKWPLSKNTLGVFTCHTTITYEHACQNICNMNLKNMKYTLTCSIIGNVNAIKAQNNI